MENKTKNYKKIAKIVFCFAILITIVGIIDNLNCHRSYSFGGHDNYTIDHTNEPVICSSLSKTPFIYPLLVSGGIYQEIVNDVQPKVAGMIIGFLGSSIVIFLIIYLPILILLLITNFIRKLFRKVAV